MRRERIEVAVEVELPRSFQPALEASPLGDGVLGRGLEAPPHVQVARLLGLRHGEAGEQIFDLVFDHVGVAEGLIAAVALGLGDAPRDVYRPR